MVGKKLLLLDGVAGWLTFGENNGTFTVQGELVELGVDAMNDGGVAASECRNL